MSGGALYNKNIHKEKLTQNLPYLYVFHYADFEKFIKGQIDTEALTADATFHDLCAFLRNNRVHIVEHLESKKSFADAWNSSSSGNVILGGFKYLAISYCWEYTIQNFFDAIRKIPNIDQFPIWLDIACLEQYDKQELGKGLHYVEPIYGSAWIHYVIGNRSLLRGWVQFECCVRGKKSFFVRTIADPIEEEKGWNFEEKFYPFDDFGFEHSEFTCEEDRGILANKINEMFGGLEDFNLELQFQVVTSAKPERESTVQRQKHEIARIKGIREQKKLLRLSSGK